MYRTRAQRVDETQGVYSSASFSVDLQYQHLHNTMPHTVAIPTIQYTITIEICTSLILDPRYQHWSEYLLMLHNALPQSDEWDSSVQWHGGECVYFFQFVTRNINTKNRIHQQIYNLRDEMKVMYTFYVVESNAHPF